VADDEKQTEQAIALFERAEAGGVKLMTLSHILFELAWTLSRRYKVSKVGCCGLRNMSENSSIKMSKKGQRKLTAKD
jgi:hypothetical protein